jgi:hypothetical protein
MNVSGELTRTAEPGAGTSARVAAEEHVFTLLRGMQQESRRQGLEPAGDHRLPFPLAGPGLFLLQETPEHPSVTVNKVARLRSRWPEGRASRNN